jgi:DNA invertase Pin-like site-specific DNA recombinase
MKKYYGYIRVSTLKQGEKGVSLQEQRAAIIRYAEHHRLEIAQWFEERVTAAKQGRPLFAQMMKGLRQGKAAGVIIHKIDRGARNLRDWAAMGELIDAGIAVYFANESLDLNSRSGRLSADIQAVVAADYIRNLRDETIKGLYGRLKQGIYPFKAPLGYLDTGGGKPKAVDPERAPLIEEAFRLYATGGHTLESLLGHLHQKGLRNSVGKAVSQNGLSEILNNSFYAGVIRIRRTGDVFVGKHQPLITTSLFRAVRAQLNGRYRSRGWTHDFMLRGLFRCALCQRALVGEIKKGRYRYYRCHTRGCESKAFREEALESAMLASWPAIARTDDERDRLRATISRLLADSRGAEAARRIQTEGRLGAVTTRLSRLVDAMLDGDIDRESFDARKQSLAEEKAMLERSLADGEPNAEAVVEAIMRIVELASEAALSYALATQERRRQFARQLCSHRLVRGKDVVIEPCIPLAALGARATSGQCDHFPETVRPDQIADALWEWGKADILRQKAEADVVPREKRPSYSRKHAA